MGNKVKWNIRLIGLGMVIFLASGCSSVSFKEPPPMSMPSTMDKGGILEQKSYSAGRSDADIDQIRQALITINETLSGIQTTKKKRKMLVFSEPLVVKKKTKLGNALSRYKVVYNPDYLRNIEFAEDVSFDNNIDLFDYIENKFNLFVDEEKNNLLISEIKEKTYKIPFIEGIVQNDIKNFLNHKDSMAIVHENMGIVVVTDDIVGHRKIEEYIKTLKGLVTSNYVYDIRVEEKGRVLLALSGEITPVTPANFSGGGMSIVVKGGKVLVSFRHAMFPSIVNFFVPDVGGTYTVKENDIRLRITIKREQGEWIDKATVGGLSTTLP